MRSVEKPTLRAPARAATVASQAREAWWTRVAPAAFLGSGLLWLAQPPVDWGWLGWVALAPWIDLIARPRLSGRRPWLVLWLAGFTFWMLAIHWMYWLHPAAWIGWAALAFYLAWYPWAFVVLGRWSVHRCGAPLWLAAPALWTSLEFVRAHLLTGFTFASLAYTQYRHPLLIQVASLGGFYALSLVMALVSALLVIAYRSAGPRRLLAVSGAVGVLAAVAGYGALVLRSPLPPPELKIALVQGDIPIDVKRDPTFRQRVFQEYFRLSQQAVAEHPDADLLVWPETMFRDPLIEVGPNARAPAEGGYSLEDLKSVDARSRRLIAEMAHRIGKPLLLGIDTHELRGDELIHFNTAILVSPSGEIRDRYDKQHLVMFGEYIPFGDRFPFLYGLTPVAGGCAAGEQPSRFRLREPGRSEALLSLNICYETVVPHLVRRQVRFAESEGAKPAVIVNLTNDGWYNNSAELDMHLACGVFRAVELARPLVIAANTGISAALDARGRIVSEARKGEEAVVLARVAPAEGSSLYLAWGDWLAWLTVAISAAALVPWRKARRA